ncbi:Na(+)-translocating NADH-quinone reductase subunit C [Methylophaga thalassica]|uniref:Na(+)-translocating NADH-quinone reductase subunit C n=1 Tax=Methylophaga thalassica TaxID=40223 RepID=UPI002E7C06A8|nr:Na(+)-translocating NADH-quinone reductase subunit C [Methylophaga thalassica]WVI85193.1 Na(+)-translocating NADH-quinone reductase subunit C [Methylophaga thalassica]
MPETNTKKGLLGGLLNLPNDDPKKTLFIAILLCLICSVMVSTAAVYLRPIQDDNKKDDIKKNILAVTGMSNQAGTVDEIFSQFEVKLVDLSTGNYADNNIDPVSYDQRAASADPQMSINIDDKDDIASIGRRANYAPVYILKEGDAIKQVVLPVHGYGLWSTLYGFLALEGDFNTVRGLRFYEQAETPGLGGEVDNPKWRAQWAGKKIFDADGNVEIRVIRGHVEPNTANAEYKVDGLSGATLTSNGVTNLLQFWLGDQGFGPYLKKMHSELGK